MSGPARLGPGWRSPAGTPVSEAGEFGLIERLRGRVEAAVRAAGGPVAAGADLVLGIGDDAAVYRPAPGRDLLLTCDVQVLGRHFRPEWIDPRTLGRRCAAVNVSDIGAMGGSSRLAIVSLAIGPQISVEDLEAIYGGMLERLLPLGATIAGGNVSGLDSGLVLDVTLVGEVEAGCAVGRRGSRPGDEVWVTGFPGAAAAGLALLGMPEGRRGGTGGDEAGAEAAVLAYLDPPARPREGLRLGRSGAIHAMIDVSDGLAQDLGHLVEDGSAGAVLWEESLPVGPAVAAAAQRLGVPPLALVLSASDDYELLFTVPPERASEAIAQLRSVSDVPAHRIGAIVEEPRGEVRVVRRDGSSIRPAGAGWDHFRQDRGRRSPG
ncbi:MAG: thiamine-phosphate kinase [Candidatus Eisenbacteria bacterium]